MAMVLSLLCQLCRLRESPLLASVSKPIGQKGQRGGTSGFLIQWVLRRRGGEMSEDASMWVEKLSVEKLVHFPSLQ